MPDEEGNTLFVGLQERAKQSGRLDHRLVPKPIPIGGHQIWNWFWELDAGRGYSATGMLSNISHVQIAAWCSITGTVMRHQELTIIMAMDRTRLKASSPEAAEAARLANAPKLTAGTFREMFGSGKSTLMASLKELADKNSAKAAP